MTARRTALARSQGQQGRRGFHRTMRGLRRQETVARKARVEKYSCSRTRTACRKKTGCGKCLSHSKAWKLQGFRELTKLGRSLLLQDLGRLKSRRDMRE